MSCLCNFTNPKQGGVTEGGSAVWLVTGVFFTLCLRKKHQCGLLMQSHMSMMRVTGHGEFASSSVLLWAWSQKPVTITKMLYGGFLPPIVQPLYIPVLFTWPWDLRNSMAAPPSWTDSAIKRWKAWLSHNLQKDLRSHFSNGAVLMAEKGSRIMI